MAKATAKNAALPGGMGSAVLEWMVDHGYGARVTRLGIPDRFVEHGTQDELYTECHYDAESIRRAVLELIGERVLDQL